MGPYIILYSKSVYTHSKQGALDCRLVDIPLSKGTPYLGFVFDRTKTLQLILLGILTLIMVDILIVKNHFQVMSSPYSYIKY